MNTIASQITSLTIVYLTVNSGTDQRKHQSSASLAFVRGNHRRPVNSPHKGPVTRKCFHLMTSSWNSPETRASLRPGFSWYRFQLSISLQLYHMHYQGQQNSSHYISFQKVWFAFEYLDFLTFRDRRVVHTIQYRSGKRSNTNRSFGHTQNPNNKKSSAEKVVTCWWHGISLFYGIDGDSAWHFNTMSISSIFTLLTFCPSRDTISIHGFVSVHIHRITNLSISNIQIRRYHDRLFWQWKSVCIERWSYHSNGFLAYSDICSSVTTRTDYDYMCIKNEWN